MTEFTPRTKIGPVVKCADHDSFCVPGAISAATGYSTGQVAQVILKNRKTRFPGHAKATVVRGDSFYWKDGVKLQVKRTEVGGVYLIEQLAALRDLKVEHIEHQPYRVAQEVYGGVGGPRLSLAALCDNPPDYLKGKILLVSFSRHMVCVQDGMICDNRTRTPIPRKNYRKGRSRVYSIIEIVTK